MQTAVSTDQLLAQLQKIREEHGEIAYEKARRDIATAVILKPNGEAFVRNAFPDLDIESLKKEAEQPVTPPAGPPEQVMLRMLQQQVPSIRTQGHYNLFMAAFDALRTTLDGAFSGDLEKARRGREALNKALDMAVQVKDMIEKLEEIPEAERSEKAKEYMSPPKEFHEYDNQKQLLAELEGLQTRAALGEWYANTKTVRDGITSPALRNELIDKIRAKRNALEAKENN